MVLGQLPSLSAIDVQRVCEFCCELREKSTSGHNRWPQMRLLTRLAKKILNVRTPTNIISAGNEDQVVANGHECQNHKGNVEIGEESAELWVLWYITCLAYILVICLIYIFFSDPLKTLSSDEDYLTKNLKLKWCQQLSVIIQLGLICTKFDVEQ